MRLTVFTDLSLRIVAHLASRPGDRVTIEEAALACGASRFHMMKVVSRLARAGIIRSSRGRGGRIDLNAPATSIRVGDVVRASEEFDLVPCRAGENTVPAVCPIIGRCKAVSVLDEALAAFFQRLDSHCVQELVNVDSIMDGGSLLTVSIPDPRE